MKPNIKNSFSCDFETRVLTKEQIEAGESTYVWAWACCKIYENENDDVTVGSTMEEFLDYVKELNNPLLYFHNEKFDGSFIVNWLLSNGYTHSDSGEPKTFTTLISKMGQWYAINIVFDVKYKRKKMCTIYDSLKKLPFSVAEIAKAFNLGDDMQKLDIDYLIDRPYGYIMTNEEKEYIKHDVIIVAKALKMMFDENMKKMTTGSDSLASYKETIGPNIFDKFFPSLELYLDEVLRPYYKGGYVNINKRYAKISWLGQISKCVTLDKNSMHPSMMCNKPMPYGEPIPFEEQYQGNEACYVQKLQCRFKLKDRYIATIQVKKNFRYCDTEYLEESIVYDSDGYAFDELVELYLPSPDLEIFFKHYDVWDIEYMGGFAFKSCTGYFFNKYINELMAIKEKEEGVKRLQAKLKMNALYGKFGTNPEVTGKIPYIQDGVLKFKPPTMILYDEEGNAREEEVKEYREPVYLPVGIFITAWSRYDIISTIDEVNKNYIEDNSDIDRFIYCDTDSIHMIGWHIPKRINVHDTHLDCWKVESYNIGAKYLRQKTYIDKVIVRTEKDWKKYKKLMETNIKHCGYENGKLYYLDIKCAGMPNNIKDDVTYDTFNIHFKSDKKLVGRQVKGGVVLLNEPFEIKPPKNYY